MDIRIENPAIKLLQTMQWSKLCWDLSWEKEIDLYAVLPEVGKTYPVHFDMNEDNVKAGPANLLWLPPHSELNGWFDKRPSEILNSYVLAGRLKHRRDFVLDFDFEIFARHKLLDCFERCSTHLSSPLTYVGIIDDTGRLTSRLQWQDATHNLRKFSLGKYVYLHGSVHESFLEVILSYQNERIVLHYFADLPTPSQYQTVITRYVLNHQEEQLFKKLIAEAEEIVDSSWTRLGKNRILGAEYM